MKCTDCEKYLFMIEEQVKQIRDLEKEITRLRNIIEEKSDDI